MNANVSHLLQMRGLKHCIFAIQKNKQNVASFTDAWIETGLKKENLYNSCRIFYRCVD